MAISTVNTLPKPRDQVGTPLTTEAGPGLTPVHISSPQPPLAGLLFYSMFFLNPSDRTRILHSFPGPLSSTIRVVVALDCSLSYPEADSWLGAQPWVPGPLLCLGPFFPDMLLLGRMRTPPPCGSNKEPRVTSVCLSSIGVQCREKGGEGEEDPVEALFVGLQMYLVVFHNLGLDT